MTIATANAYARYIAKGPFGYSQHASKVDGRVSGLYHTPGNFDCSYSCVAITYKGGMLKKAYLGGTWWSGNIHVRLPQYKMHYSIKISGLTFRQILAKLRPGDIVRGPGHVVWYLGDGKCVSFESSEKGTTHGKVGDQTGREGRIRDFYPRSNGWTHIVRPYSFTTHLGRVVADYAAGRSEAADQERANMRAPWDGPRWQEFMELWKILDRGMTFEYQWTGAVHAGEEHCYVVLGSGLAADGSMTSKFRRRLELVLPILLENPSAKVLVSGGKPRNGVTEAAAGRDWLIAKGVLESQIFVEEKSTSTIGNAKYSVELLAMHEVTKVTLVSDVQQLRRATIEFEAALALREMKNNGRISMEFLTPLAYNNYGSKPIAPEQPVSASARRAVANEVAILAGAQVSYKKALG